jgi:hypothetical protein
MKRNPRTLVTIAFFALFLLYGAFEAIKLFLGPSLVIENPKDLSTIHDPLVSVNGFVKRVAYITINDRQIFADTTGYFEDKLLLLPGYNIIELGVKDRFGNELTKELRLWYNRPNTGTTTPPTKEDTQETVEENNETEEEINNSGGYESR